MWSIPLAIVLTLHGLVHALGFVVAWRLARIQGLPYKTTVLAGRLNVGHLGTRALGLGWLALAAAFLVTAAGLLAGAAWWLPVGLAVVLLSLAMTALFWPEARVGMYVNLALLVALLVAWRVEWLRSGVAFMTGR